MKKKCPWCAEYVHPAVLSAHLFSRHNIGSAPIHVKLPSAAPVAKTTNALPRASTKIARQEQPKVQTRTLSAELALDATQRRSLDALFIAPEYVLFLLLRDGPEIRSLGDARLFLLRYKREIEGYLPAGSKTALIDILGQFLVKWSKTIPKTIDLDFGDALIDQEEGKHVLTDRKLGNLILKRAGSQGNWPPVRLFAHTVIKKNGERYSAFLSYQVLPTKLPAKKEFVRDHPTEKYRARTAEKRPPGRGTAKVTCPLCGAVVRDGILKHKHEVHGEAYDTSTHGHNRPDRWVSVFSGGSPGLGKGKS